MYECKKLLWKKLSESNIGVLLSFLVEQEDLHEIK